MVAMERRNVIQQVSALRTLNELEESLQMLGEPDYSFL